MIYTELTKKAMKVAYDAHSGQTDKSGLPYIFHPIHLAEQMQDEISACVAVLHDVIEDTSISIFDLREEGFPEDVLDALLLLTHADGSPYMSYIRAIKTNPVATTVKIADLKHNMDLSRLSESSIDDKAKTRIEKYKKALIILET